MAISTRKTNQILAEWKAGKYKSAYAVSKEHKISFKTAQKIVDGIPQTNADIIELCVIAENAKNSIKNPIEKKVVEAIVKERTIADEIEDTVLLGTLENVKATKKEVETNVELSIFDRKNAQELFDKALITSGKAPRHAPKSDINVNATANAATVNYESDYLKHIQGEIIES